MPKTASSHPELAHPKYRPDIDGLRAIAVLSVVGFHAFGVAGGYVGVDIFFVISGYLIATIIFKSLDHKSFSFIEFYQRRIRRIFPSLLLVLTACLVFGWLVLFADEYEQLGKHVAAGAGFISNLVLWSESGYFDVAAEKKPLLHLWSLGIEEQFYFLWPILAWLLWKFRTHFIWIALAIAGISFGINVYLVAADGVATFYSPLTRFWELLVGSFIAYITLFHQALLKPVDRHATLFSVLGLAICISSISFFNKGLAFPGWWATLPVLGAVLLIISGPQAWANQKILSNRLLVWFGLISFPLYLWHWPLLTFAKLLTEHSRIAKIAAVLASVLFAWISYQYIERPIRYGKHQTIKSVILLTLMFLVGVAGFTTYRAGGFEFRIDDGNEGKLAKKYYNQLEWPESYNNSAQCMAKYGSDQYCLIGDSSRVPTAAIIGDSHANHFYHGLSKYISNKGGNLILLGSGGCAPFFEFDRTPKPPATNLNCYKRTKDIYRFVLNDKDIKTVFISFHHSEFLNEGYIFEDKLQELNLENPYQAVLSSLTRTIKMLEAKGKKVAIIYDMPDLSRDIKGCTFRRPYFSKESGCNADQLSMIDNFEEYDKILAQVQKNTKVEIFDTRPYIKGNFPVGPEGNLNYRDKTHLSYGGSLFFADKYQFKE